MREALVDAKTLKIPDFNVPFEVITDASDFALGAILIQEGRPVAYESRVLNGTERNYHTTDKEMLAVVHALKVWRCYLEGTNFKVLTDHQPLVFFPTQPLLSKRQVRWSEFLSQFAMKWEFIPGVDNPADPISRPRLCAIHTSNDGITSYTFQDKALGSTDTVKSLP